MQVVGSVHYQASKMDANDKVTIKTLVKFGQACGILPSEKPSRWFYTYQFLICILNLLYSAFCMYNIANEVHPNKNSLNMVLNTLVSFFAAMQGLSFQIVSLWHPSAWNKLDENLTVDCAEAKTGKNLIFVKTFIAHVLFYTRIALELWVWYPIAGHYALMNHNFRHFNDYCCMISVLLLVHVNIIIKKKCLLLNKVLLRSHCIRNIQVTYWKILQLIDYFSVAFGYQILFLLAYTMAIMLQSLQNVLWFTNFRANRSLQILLLEIVYNSSQIVIVQFF